MKLIVNPKTKKEEKKIKSFLEDHSIDYTRMEEKEELYRVREKSKSNQLTSKEKTILHNLEESVDFVKKYKQGRVKAKFFNQLLNEL